MIGTNYMSSHQSNYTRKVLRQQRDNKKPLIVEEQTIQWPKNIGQKYQQLFTKQYVYVHRKLKIK
jgi:hypothetical protein